MSLEQLPQPTAADRARGLTTLGEIEIYTLSGANLTLAQRQGGLPSTWELLIPGSYAAFGEHTDLLFYDRTMGTGTFLTTQQDGSLQLLKWHSGWRTSWSQIVPGTFLEGQSGGNDSLLFYDRSAGHGEFYKVDGQGGISLVASHTNWRKTWHAIASGTFVGLGEPSLLFYQQQ